MKKYGIRFSVTFTNIEDEEEKVVEYGYVERSYDGDPNEMFDEEFMDSCEDDYVELPSFEFDSEMTILEAVELKGK